MTDIAPTRSAALALADERLLMRQGYQFLDEKRVLLASRMLRELAAHRAFRRQVADQVGEAVASLRAALQRHGLEGLQAYPSPAKAEPPATRRSAFLGVGQVESLSPATAATAAAAGSEALDASPEAEACAKAFAALLDPLARSAVVGGNLERLAAEYRRTERRARALENVLLPEVSRALAAVEAQLELADQEEAVRIRLAARRG